MRWLGAAFHVIAVVIAVVILVVYGVMLLIIAGAVLGDWADRWLRGGRR